MRTFSVSFNSFSGCLPESGLEGMMGMSLMYAQVNSFAGALPEGGFRALTGLEALRVDHNGFEGQ
eukprot:1245450-Amphidinium_carterae.1